jgi:hypothetical protein
MREQESKVPHFLCDTLWYGMTSRISDQKFDEIARLRAKQGFTAIQLVVGIPPEIGPENINAQSTFGSALSIKGEVNREYLNNSRQRIQKLNSLGLTAIVYGAWGQQIEWFGEKKMSKWWSEIVKSVDDLDVMYCVTGESDIWIGEESKLLPDKSTDDLKAVNVTSKILHPRIIYLGKRLIDLYNNQFKESKIADRRKKWSGVLSSISNLTSKPIFIHVLSNMTSNDAVDNSNLLDAVTVQTGHDEGTRQLLWKLPLKTVSKNPKDVFINLEPWYEGITGRFGKEDQLYAYWSSMMAGAYAYCYGAHGVWNAGDGKFMSHWGKQTLDEALKLETPRLIGLSHKLFIKHNFFKYPNISVVESDGEMISISRSNEAGDMVTYIPDLSKIKYQQPKGKIYLPLAGNYVGTSPDSGQVVIINEHPSSRS